MFYYKLLLEIFLLIKIAESQEVSTETTWGQNCPSECDCKMVSAAQVPISRWKPENSSVKTVLCVFRNESLFLMFHLPRDTESITVLQANDDSVMFFTNAILKDLQNIKSIDLQGSLSAAKIHLTNDVFHDLTELKYLSLQRVDLTGAEKAFSKLSTLEVLHVIYCDIGYLKWEMLDGLKNLKELYLRQSGIKELYGFAFYGTPELRRLFLSHNDLFSVEADAFVGLLKLEYLDLSNNRIDHLSGLTFSTITSFAMVRIKTQSNKSYISSLFSVLEWNTASHIRTQETTSPFDEIQFPWTLFPLYLHIPNIDNDALFEHVFYDLKSLSHINLRGRIKIINNRAFNGAHKVLRKLELHDCQIERVYDESFYGLENLHLLDLSENLLRSLPDRAFNHLKSIKQIYLNDNQFTQLQENLYLPLNSLQALDLYGNPWNCTCKMAYWKESIVMAKHEHKTKICNGTLCTDILEEETDHTPKCKEPKVFENQSVFQILKLLKCDKLL